MSYLGVAYHNACFFIDRFRWKEYNIVIIIQYLAKPGKPGDAKLQNLSNGSQLQLVISHHGDHRWSFLMRFYFEGVICLWRDI